jgi:hypothetical protein
MRTNQGFSRTREISRTIGGGVSSAAPPLTTAPMKDATQYEGTGGTTLTVDGVDFWSNGTPPRKFSLPGEVTSEIGAGCGDEHLIRSAVADRVKQADAMPSK